MKKINLILTLLTFLSIRSFAQAPEGINYQATVRDASGTLITNQNVNVVFVIKNDTSVVGNGVYGETQAITTNNYGGFSAIVGKGTSIGIGDFVAVDWGNEALFLNVLVNGDDLGTTRLMSVPYALHAKSSESGTFEKDSASNSVRLSSDGNNSANFIFGSPQLNDGGNPLYDSRMFFNKAKWAFRTGKTFSKFWDVDSLGTGSFATGLNTRATADYSTALGYWSKATADYTTASGYYTEATGDYSVAMGESSVASGEGSVALGSNTTATGDYAMASGRSTEATGSYSTAMGLNTDAIGTQSTAMGRNTDAIGSYSSSMGFFTIATGDYSTALGKYNTSANHLFVIGNGTSGTNRLNAMQISSSSNNTYFRGSVNPLIDNAVTSGSSFQRWTSVYATNGTIQTSDTTLKTNIKPLSYGLKELMKIKTISYQWKNEKHGITKIGFNAQNLLQIIPEVVQTHSEKSDYETGEVTYEKNKNLGVFYSDMIPVLTKSIQEQQAIIEAQQKELLELKKLVQQLIEEKNDK